LNFKIPFFLSILFILSFQFIEAQNKIDNFLKPSDTLNKKRQNAVIITEAALASVTLIGLNQIWYADYPRSNFHFINDNNEWLQMDKIGHFYSAYHLGRFGAEALNWSGASEKNQLIYGAGVGIVFLTAVEVLDGYSAEWGASSGDLIANAAGTALHVSQELLWKEQRITPKFSFHTTQYANQRPDKLGSSLNEQILKDYNGQTYWLSVNLHSFAKEAKIPKWLNIAFGYGGEAMISGNNKTEIPKFEQKPENFRQIYLSFDIDLAKINTKSHFLKTIFSVFNTIKIPAPTLEYTANKGLKAHLIYF
jgi:hypothetical protein